MYSITCRGDTVTNNSPDKYMREWLSWWSTTLPRSGSRVRVPSRALSIEYPVFRLQSTAHMREWLSWWSTTLPRSGSRVRVPSRALSIEYPVFWLQSTTHMREWLSWWSTTLPRSGPRVRVPSRAFFISYFPCFLILFFNLILCYNTP